MVCINNIKRMEKQKDIEGLLVCSVISYSESLLDYETEYDREIKERAFRFIIDEIGYEAIDSLISLLTDPDADIRLRAVECLGEIGRGMQEEFHEELIKKYEKSFGYIDYLQSSDCSCSYQIHKIAEQLWNGLKYESNFEQLLQDLDTLIIRLRSSKYDLHLYDSALGHVQKIYLALKEYDKLFTQGYVALNKLTLSNNEVCDAAKDAIRYFNLLPILTLYGRYDCDDRDVTPTKCLVNSPTKQKSFYERNRLLTDKQIQENDDYMDDIISGLYAARIEYLTKDK